MTTRHAAILAFVAIYAVGPAQQLYRPTPEELKAGYESANAYQRRADNATFKLALTPNWFGGHYLWYRNDLKDRVKEFVLVDADNGKKRPAFDHAKLAESLAKASGEKVEANRLPFEAITPSDDLKKVGFTAFRKDWTCDLSTYATTAGRQAAETGAAGGQSDTPRPGQTSSRDGAWQARIEAGQVQVKARGANEWKSLTTSGSFTRFLWSPDSKHLIAFRLLPGEHKPVYLLKSAIPGTTRAVLETRLYDQPGDKMDEYEPFLLGVEQAAEKKLALAPIMGGGQPWSNPPDVRWWKGGRNALIEFPIRGYQQQKVIEVDASNGDVKTIVDEKSPTFVDQGRIMMRPVGDSQILWRSERDGWGHLYLYDTVKGGVKQVTKGEWVVRSIERIDEQKRQVWFTANGVAKDQDPYHIHFCRINLDGTGLTDLTPGDGTHAIVFSPDRKYYVDSYSRVDMAPVHELRKGDDGKLISTLEKGEIDALLKNGVRLPERFVAKGRDGQTDIWGVIIRPTNFDPNKKYPIIENIYAGPHDSFVPKSFRPFYNMHRLAELGFIVVQIDGMGTNNRGKKFHDVCFKNVADAGFPDRILWMKAMAKKYPQADVDRVGVFGTSAGGQNSTGALLFHPEFYKVAVSSCGCHDNRIDKQWWNEQWMSYPVGPEYAQSSNIDNAAKLKGHLFLFVSEQDRNVPPESTIRLVDALQKARKEFDFMIFPGLDHSDGGTYGERKRRDFFVRWLHGVNPPDWNNTEGN